MSVVLYPTVLSFSIKDLTRISKNLLDSSSNNKFLIYQRQYAFIRFRITLKISYGPWTLDQLIVFLVKSGKCNVYFKLQCRNCFPHCIRITNPSIGKYKYPSVSLFKRLELCIFTLDDSLLNKDNVSI